MATEDTSIKESAGTAFTNWTDDRADDEVGDSDWQTATCPICGEEFEFGPHAEDHIPRCRRTNDDAQTQLGEVFSGP